MSNGYRVFRVLFSNPALLPVLFCLLSYATETRAERFFVGKKPPASQPVISLFNAQDSRGLGYFFNTTEFGAHGSPGGYYYPDGSWFGTRNAGRVADLVGRYDAPRSLGGVGRTPVMLSVCSGGLERRPWWGLGLIRQASLAENVAAESGRPIIGALGDIVIEGGNVMNPTGEAPFFLGRQLPSHRMFLPSGETVDLFDKDIGKMKWQVDKFPGKWRKPGGPTAGLASEATALSRLKPFLIGTGRVLSRGLLVVSTVMQGHTFFVGNGAGPQSSQESMRGRILEITSLGLLSGGTVAGFADLFRKQEYKDLSRYGNGSVSPSGIDRGNFKPLPGNSDGYVDPVTRKFVDTRPPTPTVPAPKVKLRINPWTGDPIPE